MERLGVIFDLDGTLWDASKQVVPAWNRVLGRYPELNKSITIEDMKSFMGKPIEKSAEMMFPGLVDEKRMEIMREQNMPVFHLSMPPMGLAK